MVVLYGKSGYGKSSLINAGIIPRLEAEGDWQYFTIRFNNFSEKEVAENISPTETLRQKLSYSLKGSASILDKLLPFENSFWYWIKTQQHVTGKNKFILFFDQFEELFTYQRQMVDEFSDQLSKMLYSTIPVQFRNQLSLADEEGRITDELYKLLYDKPEIKVVFSVRSDRLSLLNGLTEKHPAILQDLYELKSLTTDQARDAIASPSALPQHHGFISPPFDYTDGAIQKILSVVINKNGNNNAIESASLQIICRHIEEVLVAKEQQALITEELLGEVEDIFQKYYQNVLDRLAPAERKQAEELIGDHLIENGKRNLLLDTYIQNKFGLHKNLLQKLEDSSLLRKERDAAGRLLYEISHDSLIIPIEKIAKDRRRLRGEEEKKILEDRIINEQKKAEELALAKDKAIRRLKYSRISLGVALVMLAAAFYFMFVAIENAETAKSEAEKYKEEKQKAEKATSEVLIAQRITKSEQEKLKQANDSLTKVQKKVAEQDSVLSLNRISDYIKKFKKAEELIEIAKNSTKSPDKDEQKMVSNCLSDASILLQTGNDALPIDLLRRQKKLKIELNKLKSNKVL